MKGEQGENKSVAFCSQGLPPPPHMSDIFADKLGREKTLTENGGA